MAPDFLVREREYYIKQIHENNMVLSVLDAKIIPMNELDFEKNRIYCIDKETYPYLADLVVLFQIIHC